MQKIKIDIKDFKHWFDKELNRMEKIIEYQKQELENKNETANNYENRKIEIIDAAVVNGLICCITTKGLQIIDSLSDKKHIMLGYYFKMITSHIRIFEDFEFYNIALITRYLLESITGIISNSKDLENHFDEMDINNFDKEFNKWNGGINSKIKEHLGAKYSNIYKKLSRYIHPINGPLFGLNPQLMAQRNLYIIQSAIQIYIKASVEIFKICNYYLEINFEEYILNTLDKANTYSQS